MNIKGFGQKTTANQRTQKSTASGTTNGSTAVYGSYTKSIIPLHEKLPATPSWKPSTVSASVQRKGVNKGGTQKDTATINEKAALPKNMLKDGVLPSVDVESLEELRLQMTEVLDRYKAGHLPMKEARGLIMAYQIQLRAIKMELDIARFIEEQP